MKRVRALRSKASLFAGATLLAGLGVGVAASPAQAAYSDCDKGEICFYTGDDGTGKMCAWSGNDNDWRNGSTTCSWAADNKVRSVYNRGTSGMAVVYYSGANYEDREGCTTSGKKGNLSGKYMLRSHKWVNKC
ncbi:peptidase inhibitor family I36 protein [Streptomyces sp. DH10]|uniref:peptidase inhibitor family I36 protein n=1 Tax=Streptomyces sp. DH10 TaxID=3040121 RepID=UPI002442EE74|nr:peptidase inhibitor family I36 protein [Streptomyces sp. DH10]MDG9708358.1 peptidase inhibitor family I36 protein [Streptomyces sp. DH10]